jgi:hypothetical protein
MSQRRPKTHKPRKVYVAFYIEETDLERCQRIVESNTSIFEDRSTLIRYFIKQGLPNLEAEIFKDKQQ